MASSPNTSWEIGGETIETGRDFIILGSKITADGDCSRRKAMTNLDSILKNRDFTLPTKVHLANAVVFPVVMYGLYTHVWTIKKAEHQRIDAFELWCWRRLLRVLWTAVRSNQSILKKISPEYSLQVLQEEGPLPGPKTGLLDKTLGNELSKETHVLTEQETLLGKGTRAESSRVRECRRTALPHSFRVVFSQSF